MREPIVPVPPAGLTVLAVFAALTVPAVLAVPPAAGAVFPDLEGWGREGEIQVFDTDGLWKYIDGAAELFLDYGFQELAVARLSRGEAACEVHLYEMGSPLNAFGVFGAEAGDGERLAIGGGAVLAAPYQALLRQGSCYVKAESSSGTLDAEAARDLLAALAAALPGEAAPPAELRRLPAAGLVPGSERYVARAFLGLVELDRCLTALYRDAARRERRCFLLLEGPDESPELKWDRLGTRWAPLPGSQEYPMLHTRVPYEGFAGAVLTPQGIFGCADHETRAELGVALLSLAARAAQPRAER